VIEIGLALWIVAIGALSMVPVAATRMPLVYAVTILPAGYATYVLAALALAIAGSYSVIGALVLASALSLGGAAAWVASTQSPVPLRRMGVEIAGVAAVASLVAALAQVVHVTRMTPDSMTYLVAAGGLERVGSVEALGASAILKRLFVLPALEAPGGLTGRGYVASLMPLFGTAALALTGRLAFAALQFVGASRRRVRWLLASGGLFLLTTNRILFNAAYIHTHMVFATFLLLGVGLAWLALRSRRWQLLVPAALGFAVLPPLRAEAFIVVAIFLVPVLTDRDFPIRARWGLAGAVAVTTVAWFGIAVPPHVAPSDLGLTGPVYGNIVGAGALLLLMALTPMRRLEKITALAPAIVIAVLVVFVGLGAVRDPDLFQTSVAAMAANLAILGGWGVFWTVAGALLIIAAATLEVPGQRLLAYPIAGYVVAVLAFAFLRDGGYRQAAGDSGSRMMMHIVFLVVLYLIAAAGVAAAEADSATPAGSASPGRSRSPRAPG
jgi:hypothetical protein